MDMIIKRNIKNTLIAGVMLLVPSLAHAQTVSGKIVDEAGNALPYTNVVALSLPDSAFVSGTVSRDDGTFSLDAHGKGRLLRITSMGYKTVCQPLSTDMGVIILQSETRVLGEVVVKSQLPRTRLKNGAMIINVAGTILEKAGTAENLLDRIPNVTAREGKVEVFGRGTPIIYINGRQMREKSELDRISSDNIKNVEVITSPGARYDAGVTSVIRITTKKRVGEGFGLNSRTRATVDSKGNWGELGDFQLNFRTGGWEISGNLYASQTRTPLNKDTEQFAYLQQQWHQLNTLRQDYKSDNLYGKLALSYMFNTENSVGASVSYDRYPSSDYPGTISTQVFKDGILTETSNGVYNMPDRSTNLYGNAYYVGKTGRLGIDLNVDWTWIKSDTRLHNLDRYTEIGSAEQQNDVLTRTNLRTGFGAVKLVLTYPLLGGEFGFGGEFSNTHRRSLYTVLPAGLINDDNSRITEGLAAGFVDYSRQIGPVSLQAGVRYEYVNFDYYEKGIHMDGQSRKYADWFPSLSLSMPVGKTEMQLSYSSDIERPSYWDLRSSTDYINRYTYQAGNPFLLPTISRNLSYQLSYKWLALQLMYTHITDPQLFYGETFQNQPEKVVMTEINGDAYDRAFASVSLQPKFGIWQPMFSASLTRQWFDMQTHDGRKLDNPQATFRLNNTLTTRLCDITLMMSAKTEGSEEHIELTRCYFNTDLVLGKSFLKDRLSLQLYVSDLFNTADQHMRQHYGSMRSLEINNLSYTLVALTVRYKLNATKSKYRGTGAGESQRSRM